MLNVGREQKVKRSILARPCHLPTVVLTNPGRGILIAFIAWNTSTTCSILRRSNTEYNAQNVPLRPRPSLRGKLECEKNIRTTRGNNRKTNTKTLFTFLPLNLFFCLFYTVGNVRYVSMDEFFNFGFFWSFCEATLWVEGSVLFLFVYYIFLYFWCWFWGAK